MNLMISLLEYILNLMLYGNEGGKIESGKFMMNW